jgi:predicted nucleotidyltransferase component of viral defense system
MIDIKQLLAYYPKPIAENASFHKHILKEYVELLALEHLSQTHYAPKLVFIGGTCLRLVHGIDRFSEDLDFDCKNLSYDEFIQMTDDLIGFLRGNGLTAEVRDKENTRLTAYRRNIYFPGLLFEMNLTGHREERFLMKIEAQDQGVSYVPETAIVNRNGFLFTVSVPSKSVMLSMKLSALLARAKGRDFYDTIFLWQQAEPDYPFLVKRCGISTPNELKASLDEKLAETNLHDKQKDFQHLLFTGNVGNRILLFKEFYERMLKV